MGFKRVGGEEESDRDSGVETEFIRNGLSIMGDGVKRWDSGCHTRGRGNQRSKTFLSICALFLGAQIAAKKVCTTGCIPISYHVLNHSTADEPARIRHSSSKPSSKVELSPAKISRVNIGCVCIGQVAL